MIIELHLLQNFAPSNLNRDDTGAPKECEFGGHRRARLSSQSVKRAVRAEFRTAGLVDSAHLAERTRRAGEVITQRLVAAGKPEEVARQVVEALLASVKLDVTDAGRTRYLLFLAEQEFQAATALCLRHWDTLTAPLGASAADQRETAATTDRSDRDLAEPRDDLRRGKVKGRGQSSGSSAAVMIPPEVRGAFERALDGGQAVDLALFGRMIADLPERSVVAASQVAHALSTHRVSVEFDFYTAVDDLRPDDSTGADMLGTIEFNSACFYRYASLDTAQLARNLRGDAALTRQAIADFLRAFVSAIPTGKQHSMAAHNPPSFVLAVVRDRGQWNLANAFLTPVTPRADANLMQASIAALSDYWSRLSVMYGGMDASLRGAWVATTESTQLAALAPHRVTSVREVIERAVEVATSSDTDRDMDTSTEVVAANGDTSLTRTGRRGL
ncbi:MAG TPA: type I-E CRISPR-associated protein Cas7/Cse4/CasC [Ktedonobacterales bacterium]|nr:type I-E CRISPR-associated protein Cas7/Cse4/CasC [Ktedonobacterales bacterium]